MEIFRRLAARWATPKPSSIESDDDVIATVLDRSGVAEDFRRSPPRVRCRSPRSRRPVRRPPLSDPEREGRDRLRQRRGRRPSTPPAAARRPAARRRPPPTALAGLTLAPERQLRERREDRPADRPATVALHPRMRAERGLAEGDEAAHAERDGSLRLHVTLSDVVPRGVAYSPKGRWPNRSPPGERERAQPRRERGHGTEHLRPRRRSHRGGGLAWNVLVSSTSRASRPASTKTCSSSAARASTGSS
jgi:hypothetical protein